MKVGIWQLVIVLVIVVIIFGPKQLPKLGKIFGKTMKGFKDGMSKEEAGDDDEVEEVVVKKVKPAASSAESPSGRKVVRKVIEVEVDENGNEVEVVREHSSSRDDA